MARAPKLLRQEVTPMEKCFFHFIPCQQLPDDFEKDYHSVRVDAPDLSATGKFPWPIPDRGLKRRAYRIKAPARILWGDNDRINPPSYADDFQRLISGSKITTLPDAGHLVTLEQAEAFADAVGSFLAAD